MKLPNKFITFKESSVGKFVIVLDCLKDYDLSVFKLYKKLVTNKSGIFKTVDEFIETLDYLYCLGKIQITNEGVVHYVKND